MPLRGSAPWRLNVAPPVQPIRKFVIVVNLSKPGAGALAREIAGSAAASGGQAFIEHRYPVPDGTLDGCDACFVIGGDGTLLSVAGQAATKGVPVAGINMGKLGFLAMFTPEEARCCLDGMLAGQFDVSERSLIQCVSHTGERVIGLNDIVLRSHSSRVAHLAVRADDKLVNVYSADGLVFSTPTGSTAYNLSAGGPLIHPSAPVIAMTPICPHTLSNRAVIFAESVQLRVDVEESREDVHVTRDGQPCFEPGSAFPVEIGTAPERFRLIQKPGYVHFQVVQTKLGWTGNHLVNEP